MRLPLLAPALVVSVLATTLLTAQGIPRANRENPMGVDEPSVTFDDSTTSETAPAEEPTATPTPAASAAKIPSPAPTTETTATPTDEESSVAEKLTVLLNEQPVDTAQLRLVPAGKSIRLKAVLPEPVGGDKPGDHVSVPGGSGQTATVRQRQQADFVWKIDAGGIAPVDSGEVIWVPGDDGRLASITAEATSLRSSSSSSPSLPSTDLKSQRSMATATLRLLPGLRFDRDGDGTLAGAIIGIYPNERGETAPAVVKRKPDAYVPPVTFYRLDDETAKLPLSKNATLGSLNPAVLPSEGLRLVAVDTRLLKLWEALFDAVAAKGMEGKNLKVLRGFVTPHERDRLERMGIQLARFTRYQYGDALAVIYDADGDNRLDDLNKDGKTDINDAELLGDLVDEAMAKSTARGGIGVCAKFEGPNNIGTPFVHADVRGWTDRWREE